MDPIVATTPEQVASAIRDLRQAARNDLAAPYKRRVEGLKAVLRFLNENKDGINQALQEDLRKHPVQSQCMEVALIAEEIHLMLDYLEDYMQPQAVSTNLVNLPGSSYVQYDPLGLVFIMGVWNYPVQLTLLPLVGAIAAGNCVLLKLSPRDTCFHTTSFLAQRLPQYVDPGTVRIIDGDHSLNDEVYKHRMDLIFYTGSEAGGKIVAQAAAKHLTPTILELGGKSPCIVDKSANDSVYADRIIWGAFTNAGQTCVRPDYLMIHEDIADDFIAKLKNSIVKQFGKNCKSSEYYGRIINTRNWMRVHEILQADEQFIIHGGDVCPETKYVEPTILDFSDNLDAFNASACMQGEIFGPIIPILRYREFEPCLNYIRDRPHPLAAYVFTSNSSQKKLFVNTVRAGGIIVNDVLMHLTNLNCPFGGVGASGMGAYHGKASFEAFSHRKTVLYKTPYLDIPARYPPFDYLKIKLLDFGQMYISRRTARLAKLFLFGLSVAVIVRRAYIPESVQILLQKLVLRILQSR